MQAQTGQCRRLDRSSGVANRVCSAYAYCKSGLKKYTPERYRTSEAAITGRYAIPCLSKAQIECDNHQHDLSSVYYML
jgi:hypothetical protein